MKKTFISLFVLMAATIVHAADVTNYQSIVTLASSGTKNYTFTDTATGENVVIAVTISPYSSDPADAFSLLDGETRVGIGNPSINGDGNHIEESEGVNFSASLVSASSGVTTNTVQFKISGLGIRNTGGPNIYWHSSATVSNGIQLMVEEALYVLDSTMISLSGASYSGQLRSVVGSGQYQLTDAGSLAGQSLVLNVTFTAVPVDPRTNSWLTTYSGKYARIVETDAQFAAGTTETTWSRNSVSQTLPAYCGVQEIYSSTNWVYIRTTGLGSHLMGPWYNDAARSTLFVNIPANQKAMARFPRSAAPAATKVKVGGDIGYFVDGVSMFDSTDATSYSNASSRDGDPPGTPSGVTGDGLWNRDAYVNEAITFDKTLAHQQNTGVYHYHANPIGPRYLLGDNVSFNSTNKTYSESTNPPTHHSPIIGWIKDGYPLYGPYGYSDATNANSGVRRMVGGFVPRDGLNGTLNLSVVGRTNLPLWAARAYNRSATLTSAQYGPNVSTTFPLGRYIEDNDYLGDHGYVQGVDFDLDEYNGRFCVTPEFPNGTYAYFVSITAAGLPAFPYNVGRMYYGTPTGGTVTTITETVTTNFLGGPNAEIRMKTPSVSNNVVTLVWSATEGGTYRVESTADFSTWSTNSTNVAAVGNAATYSTAAISNGFFRSTRTALSNYDPVTNSVSSGTGILSVSPTSANRGTTFTLTINLDPSVNPPPQAAPVNSVTVGTISGSNLVHVSQTQVTATITIAAGAVTGAKTVSVVFPGPPGNPSATVTYTLNNGFTVN